MLAVDTGISRPPRLANVTRLRVSLCAGSTEIFYIIGTAHAVTVPAVNNGRTNAADQPEALRQGDTTRYQRTKTGSFHQRVAHEYQRTTKEQRCAARDPYIYSENTCQEPGEDTRTECEQRGPEG